MVDVVPSKRTSWTRTCSLVVYDIVTYIFLPFKLPLCHHEASRKTTFEASGFTSASLSFMMLYASRHCCTESNVLPSRCSKSAVFADMRWDDLETTFVTARVTPKAQTWMRVCRNESSSKVFIRILASILDFASCGPKNPARNKKKVMILLWRKSAKSFWLCVFWRQRRAAGGGIEQDNEPAVIRGGRVPVHRGKIHFVPRSRVQGMNT